MLKPLSDRVVLKLTQIEETTKSGIVLPSSSKEKSSIAEVVAVGPGGKDENGNEIVMNLKIGDRVVCSKYAGTEIKYENEDYIIVKQSDVLAIVED
ncbi:10 kDa chaperonin [Clostridium sp. CAG:921]|nr:10 kDa chaperonin [Clostridium sp. CAG:921]